MWKERVIAAPSPSSLLEVSGYHRGAWSGETSFTPLSAHLSGSHWFKPMASAKSFYHTETHCPNKEIMTKLMLTFLKLFLPLRLAQCNLHRYFLLFLHLLESNVSCKLLPMLFPIILFCSMLTSPVWVNFHDQVWFVCTKNYSAITSVYSSQIGPNLWDVG